ncbi:MAG: hypothetical protein P4L39_09765 [Humidesulfovibrio sp.]|nr:hypothetical protein [Humidesulfovibrio sp.]
MLDIVSAGKSELVSFETICDSSLFDLKGVLPSEMLFLCAIVQELEADSVVESGRARGVSTALISSFFRNSDINIYSVENTKYSLDAKIAEARLKKRKNLHLLYGDAFVRLPKIVKNLKAPVVFIDGPKGEKAVLLGALLLKEFCNVKAVLIHDCYKGSAERSLISKFFPESISSDDTQFIEKFRYLDAPCWEKMHALGEVTIAPYIQNGEAIESYGHTISAIINHASLPMQCDRLFKDLNVDARNFSFGFLGGLLRELKTYLPRKSYFQMI